MRLTSVLTLLALVLGAGFAATVYFEGRHGGGAIVPSVIVVDAPRIDAEAADTLERRFDGILRVPGGGPPALFGPFDDEVVGRLAERGHQAVGFALDPAAAGAMRDGAWASVASSFPRVASRSLSREAVGRLTDFVRTRDTTRPFVAGIALGEHGQGNLGQLLEPVVAALDGLPWFRRSSLVIVGAVGADDRRLVLRLDRGREPARLADDLISDLLDPRW